MTLALNAANFRSEVLESPIPVLVDFWAPWCPPCRELLPVIDRLAATAGDSYRVGKVHVGDDEDLAAEHGVKAIPTLLIFRGGKVVRRFVGVHSEAALRRALEALAVPV